jgi:hypothetical protein
VFLLKGVFGHAVSKTDREMTAINHHCLAQNSKLPRMKTRGRLSHLESLEIPSPLSPFKQKRKKHWMNLESAHASHLNAIAAALIYIIGEL